MQPVPKNHGKTLGCIKKEIQNTVKAIMLISKSLVHPHFQCYMQVCDLIPKPNTVETEQRKIMTMP